jgi:hypothetical protein
MPVLPQELPQFKNFNAGRWLDRISVAQAIHLGRPQDIDCTKRLGNRGGGLLVTGCHLQLTAGDGQCSDEIFCQGPEILTTVWSAQDGLCAVTILVDCGDRSVLGLEVSGPQEAPTMLAPAVRTPGEVERPM